MIPALCWDFHSNRILQLFPKACTSSITTRHFHLCPGLVPAAFPFHSVMLRVDSFNVPFTSLAQVTQKLFLVQTGAASSLQVDGAWSCAAVPHGFAWAFTSPATGENASLTWSPDRIASSSPPRQQCLGQEPRMAEGKLCAAEAPHYLAFHF